MRMDRLFQSPEAKKRRTDEKRRRLSFLKGKHQAAYKPSEARAPRPPRPRLTLQKAAKTAETVMTKLAKQAKNMPSDKEMEDLVWGSNEQKKKS